jgi:ABC-type uncharacterized transport system substrate-binding protein
MKDIIKSIWVSIFIIVVLSALLLFSDYDRRIQVKSNKKDYPNIALMQITSTNLLDNHISGIISRLKEKGFVAKDEHNIKLFNPQGDFGMANTIAREIAHGPYDIVITSSTVALQIFANANQSTQKLHIFGGVTDPYGTGVGITGDKENEHPPYMTGIGTFQPVKNAFKIAKQLNPKIKKIGVVWNSGEQCSEACTHQAREICEDLDIKLIEGIALNTSEVAEALRSIISKGVDAIWIGGDTVASASVNMIVNISKQAGIPVFTNDPEDTKSGALFGLGANYFTVGQYTADMAIEVLEGRHPSTFKIQNNVPERLSINHHILDSMKNWTITPELRELEEITSNQSNNQKQKKIAIINLIDNQLLEDAEKGVFTQLEKNGLKKDIHYTIKRYNAQGDISQLQQIIDLVKQSKPDIILTITTPALLATTAKIKDIPIVFTVASNPKTLNINQENIYGVYDNPAMDKMLAVAQDMISNLKIVGTIYDSSQLNSIIAVEKLRKACKEKNIKLLEMTITSTTEIFLATQSIIQKGAQALILSSDNQINTGFPSVLNVTLPHNIPVIVSEISLTDVGASAAIGISYYEWGEQSGVILAKILLNQQINEPHCYEQNNLRTIIRK